MTIMTRRQLCAGAGASAACLLLARAGWAQSRIPPHPDPATFESGDFLWPAKDGAFIPFVSPTTDPSQAERQAWEAQRRAFIEEARRSGDPQMQAAADRLEKTNFDSFRSLYFEDMPAGMQRQFGVPIPEVGHCALIEVEPSGERYVIEAMPRGEKRYASLYQRFAEGVVRTPYAKWIGEHPDYKVWHGRLDGFGAADRARIAEAAKVYLGREYWFWNLDLADETAFYCSKLLWIAAQRALGVALDGDSTTSRTFWVSPKRLINAQAIRRLHNPGNF